MRAAVGLLACSAALAGLAGPPRLARAGCDAACLHGEVVAHAGADVLQARAEGLPAGEVAGFVAVWRRAGGR